MHSATTRSTIVRVIHKLTVDEIVDNTNTPTTCYGEIFKVQNVEPYSHHPDYAHLGDSQLNSTQQRTTDAGV